MESLLIRALPPCTPMTEKVIQMTLSLRMRMLALTSRSLLASRSTILALPWKYSKSISSILSSARGLPMMVGVTFLLQATARRERATRKTLRLLFIDLAGDDFFVEYFTVGIQP